MEPIVVVVSKTQVALVGNKLVAEASTLELAPGVWPTFIGVTDDVTHTGLLFQRGPRILNNGEFGGYNYSSKSGVELVVFND